MAQMSHHVKFGGHVNAHVFSMSWLFDRCHLRSEDAISGPMLVTCERQASMFNSGFEELAPQKAPFRQWS